MTSPMPTLVEHTGLAPEIIAQIVDSVLRQARVQRVILYGSRARGTHDVTSDIDLAIQYAGSERVFLSELEEDVGTSSTSMS